MKRFSIKAAGPDEPVATLSGGNQQKVVVARWMEAEVQLLMLEEPTIGVDVGSKAEIYRLLQLSLGKGMAALLISSDFEEVERICHRALVFNRGRVVAELTGRDLTIERLTAAAAGGRSVRKASEQRHERPSARSRSAPLDARDLRLGAPASSSLFSSSCFPSLKPDTFLTYFNIRSILSNKSVQAAGRAVGLHSDGR